MQGITDKVRKTIGLIMGTGINGCVTGSSMLCLHGIDFDDWTDVPDVDVFVYSEPQLSHAVDIMCMRYGFKPLNDGEAWKIDRLHTRGTSRDWPLSTVKVVRDDVVVNITWKKGYTTMAAVLSSFDMSIIMVGYDIKHRFGMDMRTAESAGVFEDADGLWSHDRRTAVPNPLRDQDVDMYGAKMWIRQFTRVIKYWQRGFDTRPMARFYLKLIDGVIKKGRLFQTDKSEEAYNDFMSWTGPVRESIEEWLRDKEEV